MLEIIKQELSEAISAATNLPAAILFTQIERPKNELQGDLAYPCFQLAKEKKISPQTCAESLSTQIILPDSILEVTQIGPFLNFRINFEKISQKIILDSLKQFSKPNRESTIIVEYSSPNIAKPFHVGHLRATLIGNCLDRLYRYQGYKVESINHLGDWGTQFGYVYAGCKLWGEPDIFSVTSLVELYKKATAQKDQEESEATSQDNNSVTSIAREYFIRLESGEKDAFEFWKRCVDVSLEYLENTYKRLDVKFDHYLGESFYSDKLDNFKQELQNANLLSESQGAYGVDLGEDLGFARILTPDGRSLYLTRDLAAADYRAKRFQFAKSIYVVGAPQTLHFKQIIEVLKRLGKDYADNLVHVAFGHVLGMKTRGDGQSIELNDFIDEANNRALAAYNDAVQKRPDGINEDLVSKQVALAAVIFSTLNRNNIKDVHFNWDDALSFQGDSGPYLLYAYARLCGVERNASNAGIKQTSTINYSAINSDSAKSLLFKLIEFEAVLQSSERANEPLFLCSYALELAKCISKAYIDLKVIGAVESEASSRLTLFLAARNILGSVLRLLGIEPVEKM